MYDLSHSLLCLNASMHNSSRMHNVWLQGRCQACTGSAGDLSAGRPGLPQDPLQGERHCDYGWRADLLCAGLDQHPHVAQDRSVSISALTAMPYVPYQQHVQVHGLAPSLQTPVQIKR